MDAAIPAPLGAPDQVTLEKLISWSNHADDGVRYFSGTATYSRGFELTAEQLASCRALRLSLGEVKNLAEVTINGRNAGILWKPPFAIKPGRTGPAGRNTLEIRVTNLWPNRLIGDKNLPPEKRFTWTTVDLYKADSPLLPGPAGSGDAGNGSDTACRAVRSPAGASKMSVPDLSPTTFQPPLSGAGAPAWPVALLFPPQGQWTENEYLALQKRSRRLVELSDGQIEVLSMPNPLHQRIAGYLYPSEAGRGHRFGEVFFAPLPIRLWAGKYRDPDMRFSSRAAFPIRTSAARRGPRDGSRQRRGRGPARDLETKRQEYAQAGIAEYWIVDPKTETIMC